MSLTRQNARAATRLRLPALALFAAWIGGLYATDPGGRLIGLPAFPFFPAQVWGIGFIVVSVLLAGALLRHRRHPFVFTLAVMMVWLVLWAGSLIASAIAGDATFTGWAFPALIALFCYAEMVDLLEDAA